MGYVQREAFKDKFQKVPVIITYDDFQCFLGMTRLKVPKIMVFYMKKVFFKLSKVSILI